MLDTTTKCSAKIVKYFSKLGKFLKLYLLNLAVNSSGRFVFFKKNEQVDFAHKTTKMKNKSKNRKFSLDFGVSLTITV